MTESKLIVNLTRGGCVCVAELANRPLRRMLGLMGRRGLPAGEGLLLSPAPSIHTAFMRFPIDALFLDRELEVLEIVERLRPWRVAAKRGARAVLELPAGEATRRGVLVGDQLELRERRSQTEATEPTTIVAARMADAPTERSQTNGVKDAGRVNWRRFHARRRSRCACDHCACLSSRPMVAFAPSCHCCSRDTTAL